MRLKHKKVVRILNEERLQRGSGIRNEAKIPDQSWLLHEAFRFDGDEGHRPLIPDERVLIDIPVELIHAPLMVELLIDRARFHGQVLVVERELDQLARRHGEDGMLRIDASLELGPDVFEDDPKARGMDHAMAREHELAEMAIGSVGNNEIGVEKQQEGLGHLGTKVEEASIERLGQHYAVVAGQVGHQIIDRGQRDRTERGDALKGARAANDIEQLGLCDDDDLDIEHRAQRRQIARR